MTPKDDRIRWIDFPTPPMEICGLPWHEENKPRLYRLPIRLKEKVRPEVWGLATHTAGARIRFATDSTRLLVRANYESIGHMNNMCRIGQMGLDLYVDNKIWKTVFPTEKGATEFLLYENVPRRAREICLHLPLYHSVEIQAFGIDKDAELAAPRPHSISKPIVFYGTSITQGGCATHPGASYEGFLERRLDADFVNLGFSGNGKGDIEIAEAMTEIDASCYVLDFAVNNGTADNLVKVYRPFLDLLRDAKPDAPVVLVTPIAQAGERWSLESRDRLEGLRSVVREAYAARVSAGDRKLRLVEGPSLLGIEEADGFVDGVHPNDLGFQRIAERLAPVLAAVVD